MFDVDTCLDLLQEQSEKTAHDILGALRENLHCHASLDIPDGLFDCETCRSKHMGLSLNNQEFQYLKNLAGKNNLQSVLKVMDEEPFPNYKDICDKHLEEATLNKHRCVVKVKPRKHSISIADQDRNWLQQFLESAVDERRQWLNDANTEEEEWTTLQIETAEKIITKLNKGTTITLTDNQSEIFAIMLDVEKETLMENYNDVEDKGYLSEQLEILNYFLHILRR